MSNTYNVGAVLDTFDLLIMLGEGNKGQVWLARDPYVPGDLVAVKLLPCGGRDMSSAVLAWESVGDHPNIVRVLESHWAGKQPYFSMEYVDGPSLRMVLELSRGQRIPLPVAMHIMRGILHAIAFAHGGPDREPVVHGALGPDTILVETATGTVKIDDFGFAATEAPPDTVRGRMTDRLRHLAPEQLAGQTPGTETDLYAIGILLYELIYGNGPFDHLPMLSLLSPNTRSRSFQVGDLPAGVPTGLLAVLRQALAAEAEDRFTCARDMLNALHPYFPPWEEGARLTTRYTAQLARHAVAALDSVQPPQPSLAPWWEPGIDPADPEAANPFAAITAVSWTATRRASRNPSEK